MEPISQSSKEFQTLVRYTNDTHGDTHYFKATVLNAFRVERSAVDYKFQAPSELLLSRESETNAWTAAGFDQTAPGSRMLLWHGSRTTNFAGMCLISEVDISKCAGRYSETRITGRSPRRYVQSHFEMFWMLTVEHRTAPVSGESQDILKLWPFPDGTRIHVWQGSIFRRCESLFCWLYLLLRFTRLCR